MALQPWIRLLHAASRSGSNPAFNGAMALQPWILLDLRRRMGRGVDPSMEPWPFSHGYLLKTRPAHVPPARLQWSHGPSAMDTPSTIISTALIVLPLQWSHGPSAMDTLAPASTASGLFDPSMEPWPFSHGYAAPPDSVAVLPRFLQWSHGPSAMDTISYSPHDGPIAEPSMEPWPFSHGYSARGGAQPDYPFLQWSHGPSAMDTLCSRLSTGGVYMLLQWSHGPSAMDTPGPPLEWREV